MLKVTGLVALERRVRERLRTGVPRAEVARLKRTIAGAVAHIEGALARHGLRLDALSAATRRSYAFLKGLDLDQLTAQDPPPASGPKLGGISNVTAAARWASEALAALGADPQPDPARRAEIVQRIERAVTAVERICAEHEAAPSSLKAPTRRAYGWLKFLTVPANLERHLDATRRAAALAQPLAEAWVGAELVVQFAGQSALWRRTRQGSLVRVMMAEGLIAADDAVWDAVLRAALTGDRAEYRRAYVGFTETDAYRDIVLEVDLAADVDADQSMGTTYDLREVFGVVNAAYFGGALSPPRLSWSRWATARRLGYFEPQRDRVVLNRRLDDPSAPRFVVEYIVYHELLHRALGSKWSGSRMRSHTAEFRREERKFARWEEAEAWMRGGG